MRMVAVEVGDTCPLPNHPHESSLNHGPFIDPELVCNLLVGLFVEPPLLVKQPALFPLARPFGGKGIEDLGIDLLLGTSHF